MVLPIKLMSYIFLSDLSSRAHRAEKYDRFKIFSNLRRFSSVTWRFANFVSQSMRQRTNQMYHFDRICLKIRTPDIRLLFTLSRYARLFFKYYFTIRTLKYALFKKRQQKTVLLTGTLALLHNRVCTDFNDGQRGALLIVTISVGFNRINKLPRDDCHCHYSPES